MMVNALLTAALIYAANGVPVFPLRRRSKIPLTVNGFKAASADPDVIRKWWAKNPDANIGIPTGQVSGLAVIDIDQKSNGFESMTALFRDMSANAQQAIKNTVSSQTGEHGRHLYFRSNSPHIRNSTSRLGPGIDVRGEGGYVVAPPSIHPNGEPYCWVPDRAPDACDFVPLPEDLYSRMICPNGSSKVGSIDDPSPRQIPSGQRNSELTSMAGFMRHKGYSINDILTALAAMNEKCCLPPLAADEVQRIAKSVNRYTPRIDPHAPTSTALEAIARLPLSEYELVRKNEAAKLGIRVAALDKQVAILKRSANEGQGEQLIFRDPEPWPESVDGRQLLTDVQACFERYAILPPGGGIVCSLHTVFTYLHDEFEISPILCFSSPAPRCGKTTALKVAKKLTHRPLATSNVSPAALFRTIQKYQPTFIIDEADAFLQDNEEMRGILDSGHDRETAYIMRTEGDNHEPCRFSTWCPKVVGFIGTLPRTIMDRAIEIPMKRKSANERVSRFYRVDFTDIKRRLKRFSDDNRAVISTIETQIPDFLNDRQADNWRPLFTIAYFVGGDWPKLTRDAATALTQNDDAEQTTGTTLLADIRLIFVEQQIDRMPSADLVERLNAMPERPWPTYARGKSMTQRHLASLLRHFHIGSSQLWIDDKNIRGYELKMLEDAFARYLPPFISASALESSDGAASSADLSAREKDALADKNVLDPLFNNLSSVLADKTSESDDNVQNQSLEIDDYRAYRREPGVYEIFHRDSPIGHARDPRDFIRTHQSRYGHESGVTEL